MPPGMPPVNSPLRWRARGLPLPAEPIKTAIHPSGVGWSTEGWRASGEDFPETSQCTRWSWFCLPVVKVAGEPGAHREP